MKSTSLYLGFLSILIIIFSFIWWNNCIAGNKPVIKSARITVSIQAWPLIIGTKNNTLKLYGKWWDTVTWQFDTWAFRVNDQNWSIRYRTTLSATDMIFSKSGDTKTISSSNIKIKKWIWPFVETWEYNSWLMISTTLNNRTALDKPVRYFFNDATNWILGIYWDNPEISIDIPVEISIWCNEIDPCKFIWTITYTLYEE